MVPQKDKEAVINPILARSQKTLARSAAVRCEREGNNQDSTGREG
jgi:hypothetical protein